MDQLDQLLSNLPGFALLSVAQKQAALDGAQVPDGMGVWPGQPGYQPTYDVFWAAMQLLGFLQAQPFVKSAGSEGTTVSVDRPDWTALAVYFKSQSRIARASGNGVLGRVAIPDRQHVYRTDMSGYDALGRRMPHGDVDTDLA